MTEPEIGPRKRSSRRRISAYNLRFALAVLIALVYVGANHMERERLNRMLIRAIERESAKDVADLLCRGADANARLPVESDEGFSLVEWFEEVIGRRKREYQDPPLAQAMVTDQRDIVRLLVKHGADAQYRDEQGQTVLMDACWNGDFDFAQGLVRKGVDWRAADRDGWTALHSACVPDDDRCARMLLDLGIPVNASSTVAGSGGLTPLHVAVGNGSVSVVRLLLERGADVKSRIGWNGATPLHAAARARGKKKEERDRTAVTIAKMLIAAGADPLAKTNEGSTTLHGAAQDRPSLLRLYIGLGLDVNAKTKDGFSAMGLWANSGSSEECCSILLQHGADPNAKDHVGQSALAHALVNKLPRAARDLIRHGARLKSGNPKDWDPLMCAIISDEPECIRVMAEAGADLRAEVEPGVTALQYAKREWKLRAKAELDALLATRRWSP